MVPDHPDEAPPPYSAVDPLQLQEQVNDGHEDHFSPPQLEASLSTLHVQSPSPSVASAASIAPRTETPETSIADSGVLSEPLAPTVPAQFASAVGYFAERAQPGSVPEDLKKEVLVHQMIIYARSHSKDFPRRPRCWKSRAGEINQHDWDTFLNFLFPPHLNPAAYSNRLHRQTRAEIERDRKDRAQETDEERSARIEEVITEWNDYFFASRGTYITWIYVADLEVGPSSSLCPNCYPQASNLSRNRGLSRYDSMNAPIPVSTERQEQPGPMQTIKRRPVPQNSLALDSSQPSSAGTEISPVIASGGFFPGQGRNQPRMVLPESYHSSASWKSQSVAWAAQMSSIAQQYAAKISNQAQEYGRAVEETALARSRRVEMYSKKVEQDALARARQIEAMTLAKGQKIEQAGDRIASWASNIGKRGVYPRPAPPVPMDHSYDQSTYDFTRANQMAREQQSRCRRQSNASEASISSLSSIDAVSSVSDLEPDDLVSIREQLSTLDAYHDHELYDAAVSLRSQLEAIKQSRSASSPRAHSQHRSWGRWESPEEATKREQRRVAMKQESKLLREKFSEIERRAKREVRDLQKARRDLKRTQRLQKRSPMSSAPSLQAEPQRPRGMPERTVSDMTSDLYKEVNMGPPGTLDRTISEPIHQVARRSDVPPSVTSSTSTSTTAVAAAVNPHEAAKAWTEAQRLRVKEIQKANKERIKEIQKSYKEHEKQQRKAMKKLAKQKHTAPTLSGVFSSSTANLETGTARLGAGQPAADVEDEVAIQSQRSRSSASAGTRETDRHVNEVSGTFIAELDGTSIGRK